MEKRGRKGEKKGERAPGEWSFSPLTSDWSARGLEKRGGPKLAIGVSQQESAGLANGGQATLFWSHGETTQWIFSTTHSPALLS